MTMTDEWVYVPELAAALGITQSVLRRYHTDGRWPPAERDPRNGRLRWRREIARRHIASVISRRAKGLAGAHGWAIDTHKRVAELDNGRRSDAEIASILGVSRRTVYRHRNGKCRCETLTTKTRAG